MSRRFFLTIIMLALSQFLQASEKTEANNSPNMQINACIVELNVQSKISISIQEALDLCVSFVEKSKIDFNINASDASVRINHSRNGITLDFIFVYKYRCLIITIDESKKVASWKICNIDM